MIFRSDKVGYNRAFTIVELLVVIVVIGILAAITTVSYSGIAQRAKVASMKSDLASASRLLKAFQAVDPSENFPATINCGIPDSSTNKCLKASAGYSYTYSFSNASNPKTFTLDITNGSTVYRITESSLPTEITTTPVTAIAAITGTSSTGSVITAGSLTPAGATVSYQWQSATTAGGVYSNIAGATSSTYTLQSADWKKYIKVVVTGTGSYSGVQTSAATAQISNPNWASGIAAALAGKYVSRTDAPGTYTWANRANGCVASGGRVPTLAELSAIYTHKSSYGDNFSNNGYDYWSNTPYDANNWYVVTFTDGSNFTASNPIVELKVRCVSD